MSIDLLRYANNLHKELQSEGIYFNDDGFPKFPEEIILKEIPDAVSLCPMTQRLQISNKENVILCHYENDTRIFQHLSDLEKWSEEAKKYYGVSGFDLSPRTGMNIDYQYLILLINQMATLRMGLYGCSIVPNFRIGSIETINTLKSYPEGIWYTAGVLGCFNGDLEYNIAYMKSKIMFANPHGLLIYGQLRKEYQMVLDEIGIQFRVFEDFQRISRRKTFTRRSQYGSQD